MDTIKENACDRRHPAGSEMCEREIVRERVCVCVTFFSSTRHESDIIIPFIDKDEQRGTSHFERAGR